MKKALLVMFLFIPAMAGQKVWQEAVVAEITSTQGPLVTAPINGMWIQGRITWTHYIIETADIRYDLTTRKPVNITLHGKTKVASQGTNAFLLDDDGKEKKLQIVLKTAK